LSQKERARLFLDSNVLTAGIVSTWGLDKAVLSLCAARICRLVLAEAVREEVEDNLLIRLSGLEPSEANLVLDRHARLIALMRPEIVPYPDATEVKAGRYLIRHAADVPVLLSAMAARPDWFLTHNTRHFTPAVARRTGLRFDDTSRFLPRALEEHLGRSVTIACWLGRLKAGRGQKPALGVHPSIPVGGAGADKHGSRGAQSHQLVGVHGQIVPVSSRPACGAEARCVPGPMPVR